MEDNSYIQDIETMMENYKRNSSRSGTKWHFNVIIYLHHETAELFDFYDYLLPVTGTGK